MSSQTITIAYHDIPDGTITNNINSQTITIVYQDIPEGTITDNINSQTFTVTLNEVSEDNISDLIQFYPISSGADGDSAYDIAVDNGFVGTEEQWLASLKGDKGDKGDTGNTGATGANGYTPIKGVDYFDGAKGDTGNDGYTPIKGVDYFDGATGAKGDTGNDGYTPIKGIDYFDGTNGTNGIDGTDGTDGVGIPIGGTTGQVLAKKTNTDYDTEWITSSAGGVTSFNSRTGIVLPVSGDYTADKITETTTLKFFLNTERTKLAGIADNANNYTHPANHSPSIITQDTNNRFVTDAEKSAWNGKQDALGFIPYNSSNPAGYISSETSHADVVVDGDFTSQGIMLRGASSGTYSILTDNSSNWNTAYTNMHTHANKSALDLVSGTNTGDETETSIKTKLGISVLSGSNTGDQDLSGYVLKTTTVNSKALNANIVLSTADIADSTNKRYVTDAHLTLLGNTSGTNSGDNAVNSLYSGLATSKQDTLVSGTNIKTVNSTSLLGSGDITVQATLVSGTNIKTVDGVSLLGSGNIKIGTRTSTTTSAASITPNVDSYDNFELTALAVGFTLNNQTGTPVNFQKLMLRIKDNGSAQTIGFGTNYVAGGVALPTTTVAGKYMHLGFIYNTANSLNKWMLVALTQEA